MNKQNQIVHGNRNSKLLVSILVDNSSSMKGQKIQLLKAALKEFNESIIASQLVQYFEYSVVVFDGLNAKNLKPFSSQTFDTSEIPEGGLALWNKSILEGIHHLEQRLEELKKNKIDCYKPWFIWLSDGQCYEKPDKAVTKLNDMYKSGYLTFFPFALSNNFLDEKLDGIKQLKRSIIISNNQYNRLFEWLYDTVKQRVTTPFNDAMKLESTCFDGWTEK